jgi:hypothetical protein
MKANELSIEEIRAKRAEYMRKYRAENLEKCREYRRNYYKVHKEKLLEYNRRWRERKKAEMNDSGGDLREMRAEMAGQQAARHEEHVSLP